MLLHTAGPTNMPVSGQQGEQCQKTLCLTRQQFYGGCTRSKGSYRAVDVEKPSPKENRQTFVVQNSLKIIQHNSLRNKQIPERSQMCHIVVKAMVPVT
jgi:hypothetical protein